MEGGGRKTFTFFFARQEGKTVLLRLLGKKEGGVAVIV